MDLVPGRSGTVRKNWLAERGEDFRAGARIATLDPLPGTARTPLMASSKTQPACAAPVTSSSSPAMPQMRCAAASSKTLWVTAGAQAIPLPNPASFARLAPQAHPTSTRTTPRSLHGRWAHISVEVAYHCAQQIRDVFHQDTPAQGRRLAARLAQRLPTCPIPEIARLGRTLRKWKDAILSYFDTAGASDGPTETINGIIELGRRTARGYPNPTNHKLRMLLITGGLDTSPHTQL